MSIDLKEAISTLKRDVVMAQVQERAKAGENPVSMLTEMQEGMQLVGDRFEAGDSFLAELILSGEIFKKAMLILDPYLAAAAPQKPLAKIVMATLKGDVHDLGKGIVCTLLKARGFEVHDIGVDVEPQVFIDKVKEVKPEFVGFSGLLTTVFPVMKEAVEMLEAEGLRDNLKVMIGGGIITETTREYVKADFHTTNAMAGVSFCLKTVGAN